VFFLPIGREMFKENRYYMVNKITKAVMSQSEGYNPYHYGSDTCIKAL